MKYIIPLFLISLLVANAASAEENSKKIKKIGFLIPLSGNFMELGSDNREGVEAALAVLDRKPNVEIVYGDSKADPATAISEFKKLVNVDGISGLFVMRSPVGMAINPISRDLGVPILGGVGQKKFVPMNQYAWQVWSNSSDEGSFLARQLIGKGFKNVAIVTAQDDWTSDVSESLRQKLEENKIETVNYDLLPTEMDFRTVISKIKSYKPDVTVVNLSIAQIGVFLRQAGTQGLQGLRYSNFWSAKKQVIDSAGLENIEGVRFVEMDTDLPIFRKTIKEKFQSTPNGATLTSYVATLLLMQAFTKFPEINSSSDLYNALRSIDSIETPDGPIAIKDRHVQFPLVEKVIHEGKAER